MKIIWAEQAVDDFVNILNKLSKESAQKYAKDIDTRISSLKRFPMIGRMIPEFQRPERRELIYKGYRILYKYDYDIHIISIKHSRMQLPDIGFE